MVQITTGLRSSLSSAGVYSLLQNLLGAERRRRILAEEYIRAQPGDRVLDIGCGPAEILEHLPGVTYLGFDENPAYVASAVHRFGTRGTFLRENVNEATLEEREPFDVVLALAILHHLEDHEAEGLFRLARHALKPGGRLITLDCCFVPGQAWLDRFLIEHDRGQNCRTEEGYRSLALRVFPEVRSHIRQDFFRVPYTHIILECEV